MARPIRIQITKTCVICNETKEVSEFPPHSFNSYRKMCNACYSDENKKKYQRHRKIRLLYASARNVSGLTNIVVRKRLSSKEGRLKNHYLKAKNRKNKEFTLTEQDLFNQFDRQNGKCALSGVEMTFETGDLTLTSLDRIDSDIGYTQPNIQFVCWYANKMKQDLNQDKFIEFCKLIGNFNIPTKQAA